MLLVSVSRLFHTFIPPAAISSAQQWIFVLWFRYTKTGYLTLIDVDALDIYNYRVGFRKRNDFLNGPFRI